MIPRILLSTALAVGGLLMSADPAAACSAGPTWDRRAETEMFVLGRILSVELRPNQALPPKSSAQSFQKVVTMKVDLVLKGRPATTVTFVDSGYAFKETLIDSSERIISWGGGGDCSAIEADPTGRYGAFALGRWNGELYSSILLGSAFGNDASDPAIAQLIAGHGLSLPSTSTRPRLASDPALPVGAAILAAASLGLIARLRSRLRTH